MSTALSKKKKTLVSISQAAKFLGVSIDTVRRWDKAGILHSIRVDGKNRYFPIKELEKQKSSKLLSISEASSILGISVTTLRRLEKKGLLIPKRNKAGERAYTKKSLETFKKSDYFSRKKPLKTKGSSDYIIEKPAKDEPTKSILGNPISTSKSSNLRKSKSWDRFWDRTTEIFALSIVFALLIAIGATNIKVASAQKTRPTIENKTSQHLIPAKTPAELSDAILSGKELEELEKKEEPAPDNLTLDYLQSLLQKASDYKTKPATDEAKIATSEATLNSYEGSTLNKSIIFLSIIASDSGSIAIHEKAATDSAKIGTASYGEIYEMISRIPDWYQIKLNNSLGFIPENSAQIKEIQ